MSQALFWLEACYCYFTLQYWKDLVLQFRSYTKDVVEHLILSCCLYITLCVLLYLLITKWKTFEFNRSLKDVKRALIVIAHPDDECMFFGPTVRSLVDSGTCTVYLMCMSTGDSRGVGKRRKTELYNACRVLGIDDSCIMVYNHSLMQDSMTVNWPTELLANLILQQIETYGIDTLITFDKHGVSRHVNHCSLYYAIAHLSLEKRLPDDCRVLVLESVNIIRKYWFILDIPLSYLLSRYRYILNAEGRANIRKAMKEHKTQLVWYRKLYVVISRYVLLNTLQLMDVSDIELDLVDD